MDSVREENLTIRAKLLSEIESGRYEDLIREFSSKPHIAGSEEDFRLAIKVHDFFKRHNFERPTMKNYSALLSLPNESKPNHVTIVDSAGRQLYSSLSSGKNQSGFSIYSPSGNVTVCICLLLNCATF